MKTRIWYHAGCYDGFGAAYSAYKKFGINENTVYVPVAYGNPIPEYDKEDTIYMLDFSVKRDKMLELKSSCKELIVLDHHKTAEEECKGLDFCTFDMTRSGAGIAWDYFHPAEKRPGLINMIEDRDLWSFTVGGSAPLHVYLCSQPMDFQRWNEIDNAIETGYGIDWMVIGETFWNRNKMK